MRKSIIAIVLGSALALSACGESEEELSADELVEQSINDSDYDEPPGDSHIHIDPVAEDPNIAAQAVAASFFTWNPAEQMSVWNVNENVIDQHLTGELREQALNADSEEALADTPDEWEEWALDGVRFQAIIPEVNVVDDSSETERRVAVNVTQYKLQDGTREVHDEFILIIQLVAEDGHWRGTLMDKA